MKTKGGKMSWGSKHRIALTVLFNTYLEDSTDDFSYETSYTLYLKLVEAFVHQGIDRENDDIDNDQ